MELVLKTPDLAILFGADATFILRLPNNFRNIHQINHKQGHTIKL